jgi:hypothetical protein
VPFFVALRLCLVGKSGFSAARLFHPCFGYEEISSGILAAAQSSLICLEDLLSKSGPIISFLFQAHVPLASAFIFACSSLIRRILSLLARAADPRVERVDLRF